MLKISSHEHTETSRFMKCLCSQENLVNPHSYANPTKEDERRIYKIFLREAQCVYKNESVFDFVSIGQLCTD